jgi:hypothetical protein
VRIGASLFIVFALVTVTGCKVKNIILEGKWCLPTGQVW